METWLVTGGAGFIGSCFVRIALALRPAVRVVVLDKLTYAGRVENLADLPDPARFELVRGDIARGEDVAGLLSRCRPTRVVNLAAETHVDRSIDGPRACVETNLLGTFELLEAIRRHLETRSAVERERFRLLHVSTDEVYGSLGPEGRFSEATPYAPNSPYSATKAGADLLVRAYHRTYAVPAIVTNCSNNYGPRQLPEKLIPLMIYNALEARDLPIYGDGSNVRDWIFVEDHCRGILRAIEAGIPGEQYAFGADSEHSNLALVDGICEGLERIRPARENAALRARGLSSYAALKRFVPDRPGHDHRYAIDASRARRELGWRPETRFEDGLARTLAWYVENDAWRRAIEAGGDLRGRQGLAVRGAVG
ncbi:MAG: dTDP-glucose 4,6-dehydratase [Deltaproteobacteria bacterium]|nr:dTDP-glucose 4,6-dehydratase [Deltaproteobacteria bacterium]